MLNGPCCIQNLILLKKMILTESYVKKKKEENYRGDWTVEISTKLNAHVQNLSYLTTYSEPIYSVQYSYVHDISP